MKLERHDNIAVLRLNTGKANAMSTALLTGLGGLIDELSATDARAAVIVGYDKFFSAGLDLPALLGLDREQMRTFIELFGSTMQRVFQLPLPVVAAINGHAIAGGCVLALQADYRLMTTRDSKIGLNEVQLGIGLPAIVSETLRIQVPAPSLRPIALEGRLFSPADALAVGLVHELVDGDQLESAALAKAQTLANIPAAGYRQTKAGLRRPAVEAIGRSAGDETETWLDTWFTDEARRRISAAVARFAAKK